MWILQAVLPPLRHTSLYRGAFTAANLPYEAFYLLGYNALQTVESQPAFRSLHVPTKRRLTFNRLHCVISEKIDLHNHCCENLKSYSFILSVITGSLWHRRMLLGLELSTWGSAVLSTPLLRMIQRHGRISLTFSSFPSINYVCSF
jgi:hypothetical protein